MDQRDIKYWKRWNELRQAARTIDLPAPRKKIEVSLDVPKFGILTSARGQVVHELVLHQSFLFHELQRPS
jgi:hypothetical protein